MSYSESTLLASLQDASNKVSGELTYESYREIRGEADASPKAHINQFGSWNQAKKEAGLSVLRERKSVNDDYFARPLTTEKAYWAGMLMGDGCVRGDRNRVQLGLNEKNMIEKFKSAVDSEYEINQVRDDNSDRSKYYRTRIGSEKMVNDLCNLGVVPRKTTKDTLPELPDELWPHFVRGLFDADGSASKRQKSATISHCQNRLRRLQQHIPFLTSLHNEPTSSLNGKLYFGANQLEPLYDWMYPTLDVPHMTRKRAQLWNSIEYYNY